MLRLMVIVGVLVETQSVLASEPVSRNDVYKIIERMEIEPQSEKPEWAKFESPPLFTFVWMSDFHLDGSRLELLTQAFRYVDEELEAHFVMITGDNNAYASEFDHQGRIPPVTLCRQLFMQRFLKQNLRTPYVIIPGDDWPQDFEKVFGPFQFSFNYGGIHFLFTSLDRCAYGVEGRAVFDESTWEWMRKDLKRNKDRPTLFMMHESISPPSFLDAVRARNMLQDHPSVIASFCGHLHTDVQFQIGGLKYLVCPGFGPNPRHGFKVAEVHREALVLGTIEYNAHKQQFEQVVKWQRIDIPESLQASLHKPCAHGFTKQNYSEVPPHPRRGDPQLLHRSLELVGPLMRFLGESMIPSRP
jgi:hypothetical protein